VAAVLGRAVAGCWTVEFATGKGWATVESGVIVCLILLEFLLQSATAPVGHSCQKQCRVLPSIIAPKVAVV
jgi:hypothetical protein